MMLPLQRGLVGCAGLWTEWRERVNAGEDRWWLREFRVELPVAATTAADDVAGKLTYETEESGISKK